VARVRVVARDGDVPLRAAHDRLPVAGARRAPGRGRRGDRLEAQDDEAARTPLAVVLEAARAAAANGDLPRRRRALESVARELGRIDLVELAADARTLAWSPREATRDDVEELARRAELAAGSAP
jgi:hypothetical protein